MATLKQQRWQKRGQLLWRLKGFNLRYFMRDAPMTKWERDSLTSAITNIENVVANFSQCSKELGFNVKEKNDN